MPMWRAAWSAAHVVTESKSNSRGLRRNGDIAAAINIASIKESTGKYIPKWKFGENHSEMYACMARECTVCSGYQYICVPYGFNGTIAMHAANTNESFWSLGQAVVHFSKPKAASSASPMRNKNIKAIPI